MSLQHAVNWFDIPVKNMQRARDFYEYMLDTRLQPEEMDGMQMAIFPGDDAAVRGSLVQGGSLEPSETGTLVYLNVDGFMDAAIDRAQQKGARVVMPKTAIGEYGYIAQLTDGEGNRIAMHSM